MTRQRLIKLPRNLMQLMQPRPGDRREIMVLVVQAHVVGQHIQWAVVRIRFRRGEGAKRVRGVDGRSGLLLELGEGLGAAGFDVGEEVVLGDEVAGAGVERAG